MTEPDHGSGPPATPPVEPEGSDAGGAAPDPWGVTDASVFEPNDPPWSPVAERPPWSRGDDEGGWSGGEPPPAPDGEAAEPAAPAEVAPDPIVAAPGWGPPEPPASGTGDEDPVGLALDAAVQHAVEKAVHGTTTEAEPEAAVFDQDVLGPVEGAPAGQPTAPEPVTTLALAEPAAGSPSVALPPVPARRRRGSVPRPRLGELPGRTLDHAAVDVNAERIGKLEPEWGFPQRMRSFVLLVVIVAVVAIAVAGALAVIVEIISATANHMISKSS